MMNKDNRVFLIKGKVMNVVGHFNGDEFIVHKGSVCNPKTEASEKYCPCYHKGRVFLEQKGYIKDNVFTEDVTFISIANATGIITCSTRPPKSLWKTHNDYGALIKYSDYIEMKDKPDVDVAERATAEERERGVTITRYMSGKRAIEWRGMKVKLTA